MEINKLHEHDMNQLNVDNTKTKSLDVDNLKTDNFNYDEESYCDIRDYSKVNRRIVKATKVVGIALTITAAALLTGTVISNVFLGKLPKLENLEYVVEGNTVNLFIQDSRLALIGLYNEFGVTWEFQWYAFPFQLCSSQLYLLPFVAFLKDGKIRDSIIAFLATYSLFGGLVVFIYPNDVFVSTIGINIQTMVHHGLQLVLGVFLLVYYRQKINWRFFTSGIIVFVIMCTSAMSLNIVMYHTIMVNTGNTFNMFYFSPYFPCSLPVLGDYIWPNVPYPVFLLTYLIGFTVAAAVVFALQYYIIKGVQKIYAKKNK